MSKKHLKKLLIILFYSQTIALTAQNLTIDDLYTPQQLVENVLVNSSCALVSNFKASGDNLAKVGKTSYGYFINSGGGFPFKEGLVLGTSYVQKTNDPFSTNMTNITGNDNDDSWKGDIDLDATLNITSVTATSLEFDFTALTNFLSFEYFFASNEYFGNSSCLYTDGFVFLIKENSPGAVYKNLAVIPGTNTPVSSKSIRPNIPQGANAGCAAVNPQYFNGLNNPNNIINFAGQTVVMTAQTSLEIGKNYHIKLVIGNDKNEYFDSAVFLKAGSFSPKIDLGSDRLLSKNPICFGEIYTIDTQLSNSYNYKWYKNKVEIIGENNSKLNVTENGTYKVEVDFSTLNCTANDEIKLEYASQIQLSNTTLLQCDDDNDGITTFNLTKVDNIIKNNNTTLSPIVYFESLAEAQGEINPILTPNSYTNKPTVNNLYARVTNAFGCPNYAQLTLGVNQNILIPSPIEVCDTDSIFDGFYEFDLNAKVTQKLLNGLPLGLKVEYYLNKNNAILQKNILPNLFTNTIANEQTIQARIVNGPDCFDIVPINLLINSFNPVGLEDETLFLCEKSTKKLTVPIGFSDYLWSTGETTNSIEVNKSGEYWVEVYDGKKCSKRKNISVNNSEIASITNVLINDFSGNNNNVQIEFTGVGNYEFSIDGNYYQENSIFKEVAPGKYIATIRNKNGCGLSNPYDFFVLDYLRFFTPNGDRINDLWEIKNKNIFPNSSIDIYNRFGKLLFQINNSNTTWDGTYEGNPLASDDYWFLFNFGTGKIVKGHFSLKR